jgi:probable rRNA maturation factor
MNIAIANRQRTKKVNARLLRQIVEGLFAELEVINAELGINLVGAREMTLINENFLQHEGSTDVITFDHSVAESGIPEAESKSRAQLHGELFVCVDEAVRQAREFKASWQSEVVRYVVHGVLHLVGHDDLKPHRRRKMKREENRLLRALARRFSLAQIGRVPKISA